MTEAEQRVWDIVFAHTFTKNNGCARLAISQADLAIYFRRKHLDKERQ